MNWLDHRTGLITAMDRRMNRCLTGAPCWRYVLPAVLAFALIVELITGVFLWMFYSPSAQTAWESVFWIQEIVYAGWLLRGIHFFAGHAMVVVAGLYLVQLILTGMYRAPREFNFWIALGTFGALLGLLLTGDLLRWDQEGYWATQVRTGFLNLLPVGGSEAIKVAVGGPAFGHLTLTHFFALHGVAAIVLAGIVWCNGSLVRRHGLRHDDPAKRPSRSYWPGQATLNFFACGVFLAAVVLLVLQGQFTGSHVGQLRGEYLGAPLGAPANPAEAYAAARPEWAFLALYQFAAIFPGSGILGSNISWKAVPIFIVPGMLGFLFFVMPFVGLKRIGHVFNVILLLGVGLAAAGLSAMCVHHDQVSEEHQKALKAGHEEDARARELAKAPQGIPPAGALALLQSDPKTQGPKLFAQHCVSCHNWTDAEGHGLSAPKVETAKASGDAKPAEKTLGAPNLHGFASRPWLTGLLNPKRIRTPDYFGNTNLHDMADWVKDNLKAEDMDADAKKQLEAQIAALSAEAGLKSQAALDASDKAKIADGKKQISETCNDCHVFHGKGTATGPELTGYGSREWMIGIVSNAAHPKYYGKKNDRMPIYAEFPNESAKNRLSAQEIGILVDWLRGEWYERK